VNFRIAIGEFAHETNTFCGQSTAVEAFTRLTDETIYERYAGTRTYVGGMLAKAVELAVTAVPTFAATTEPSGTITAQAYEKLLGALLEGIARALPVDAVCLSLHGAGVAEGVDDLEGAVLGAVRDLVGPTIPLVATLDLHGNITQAMVEHADGLFGVNFFPHTDSYERGAEAMAFVCQLLRGQVRPVMYLERLPMMITANSTDLAPMRRLNECCWAWEKQPNLVDCTIFHGFPYTDVPVVGMSVLAIADGDATLARSAAKTVARAVWDVREQFRPTLTDPAAAIARALAIDGGPVVINDTADNPGGGAPGDSTHLLRAMLEASVHDACYAFIYDRATAAQAHDAGVGTTIRVRLGGKTDTLHGTPIEAEAYIKCLTDGQFRYTTPMWRGMAVNLGPMARLQIGGLDILVASERTQVFDDEVFLLHGIDVRRYKIVALKSAAHFRAGYSQLATSIITADSPGATARRLEVVPFRWIPRPIWPLDPQTQYNT
jgi:microcystin degradation protein MlrC